MTKAPLVTCLQYKLFENAVGNEKLLVMSNFSFCHSVFNGGLSTIFIKFEMSSASSFSFGKVNNLSFWKGLKIIMVFN